MIARYLYDILTWCAVTLQQRRDIEGVKLDGQYNKRAISSSLKIKPQSDLD